MRARLIKYLLAWLYITIITSDSLARLQVTLSTSVWFLSHNPLSLFLPEDGSSSPSADDDDDDDDDDEDEHNSKTKRNK